MRLFLQITITDRNDEPYEKPLLSFASSLADDIIGTDLDSQSDPYVVDLVTRLLEQAKAVFLLVVARPGSAMGGANALLNNLLKNERRVGHAVLSGDHVFAEKMLRPFGDRFIKANDEEEIKTRIREFAGKMQSWLPEN